VEQSIAATDSSQNILPAGLGLRLAKPTLPMALDPLGSSTTLPMAFDPLGSSTTLPMAFDSLGSSTTLPMAFDPLESFTTSVAFDPPTNPSTNSLMPTALDSSARKNISSIHSKEKLQKPTNLSAVLDLHSTSCSKSNQSFVGKYVSNFQLVVAKLRQTIKAKLRQTIQVKFCLMIQAKLHQNQVTPATIRNDSFKLIDMLASEGAKASIRQ
jgi:hypothetical protein